MKKTEKKATLNVDGKELNEKQVRALFEQRGLRQDSSYILEHMLPRYQDIIYEAMCDADNTDELLRCQGAAKILKDMVEYTKSVVKKITKVEIT